MEPTEELAPGSHKSWEVWKSSNRPSTGITSSRGTLHKRGYLVASVLCDCGDTHTTTYVYICLLCPDEYAIEDLMAARENPMLLVLGQDL